MSARARFALDIVRGSALVLLLASAPRIATSAPPVAHHPGKWIEAATWPGRSPTDSVHAVHMALLRGDTLFARPHSQVLAWGIWTPSIKDGGLWAWNPTTDVATQAALNLTPLAVEPPPYNLFCAGHSSMPDASGDLLVVGGTQRGHSGENLSARFSANNRNWGSVATMAGRRWYGNATVVGGGVLATAGNSYDHMVVFGGKRQNDGVVVNDVRRYAITNAGHWDAALVDQTPGTGSDWPDSRESPTLADQEKGPYFLFGGKDATGTRRDVWQLRRKDNDFDESYVWQQLLPSGSVALLNRWRHAAAVATPNTQNPDQTLSPMYIHGGEQVVGSPLGDLWKLEWRTDLNPNEWRWTLVSASGTAPTSRSGHSAIWDRPNQRMIVFGGQNPNGTVTDANVYVFRPGGSPNWSTATLAPGSSAPSARTRHAMAGNLDATTATGIVFGGETSSGLSSELWEFSVDGQDRVTWTLRPPNGPAPAPRAGATVIYYELHPLSYLVVGGDLAGGVADSTVWEYRRDTNSWSTHPALARALTGHAAFREHRVLTPLQAEHYDPTSNVWTSVGDLKKRQSYHMIFAASDGELYSPGPTASGVGWKDSTWRFKPGNGSWELYAINDTTPMSSTISGVLYRPGLIMKCGGLFTSFEANGATKSLQTGLSVTPQQLATWRSSANSLQLPRTDHILTLLPTGEVLASGGQGKLDNDNANPYDDDPRTRPEIWDPTFDAHPNEPGGEGWWYGGGGSDTLASAPVTRGHHSSAVILPDGRLLSGGGWDTHPVTVQKTVDQFSPPYLFKPIVEGGAAATRPQLLGAQDHIPYGQTFRVACANPIVQACLIRPGASTHSFTQDSRYVPLTILSQGTGGESHHVTMGALNANDAPPGNYLLFVLVDDNGRKVPSVARWVNVGSSLPSYATWDIAPPSTITDLDVTNVQGYTQTVQWTAPSDGGYESTGKAHRYELRYRANAAMATLDDFFTHGRRVNPALLPAPAPSGTSQSVTVTLLGLAQDTLYHFAIISRDGAGSDRNWSALSNDAWEPQGGGCPFVDTRTADGWEVENSILGRSLTGSLTLDGYRLRHTPQVVQDRVNLRIRENEQELTTLDQVRLIAVDHAPGVRAFAVGEKVLLGTPVPTSHARTSTGADVTTLFSGTNDGFQGGPGDTVVVEFAHTAAAVIGEEQATTHHDPFHMDDGGKCPPDCGYPLRAADPHSAAGIDAQVLANSGIQLQTPDGVGGWRTLVTRYPREHRDETVFEDLGHGPVRLVFVGRHTVRSVGRLEAAAGSFTARKLPLLAARHTRFGDVAAVVDTTGNLSSQLAPGDTIDLEFGWVPVPDGHVRELFLLSRGVYTAALPAQFSEAPPERFAVLGFRPNPFAASATLRLDLPIGSRVRLEVFDPQGRRVRVVSDAYYPPGSHGITWDGRNDAGGRSGAGVFFYRLTAGENRAQGRFIRVP